LGGDPAAGRAGVTHGFVLGKFMPPHAGHVLLCATARRLVDRLTILVCWLPDDPVPGPVRLAWMRALFPDCRVIGHDAIMADAAAVAAVHPEPIDRVFAGDVSGRRLAEELDAEFILVGPRAFPDLSSRAVRADPWAHWDGLPAPVRAHYARSICLHGPESTGKSTLAPPLAAHFGTLWVPEYGRTHCELNGFDLDDAGLVTIGRTQSAMTRAALPWCNRRLIVDTDALTTAAWSIMILGHVPDGVLDDCPVADLYLLTDIDIPWEDDGTRYFPAPADRRRFMAACERVLDEAGVKSVRIGGDLDARLDTAIAAIAALEAP
jgi:HTH-type transcriptional regulator, transcriptional repressor of NAD biosynthesis genes